MAEVTSGAALAGKGMSWLEWSASIIGSTAWPIAAVVIALVFRSQIRTLLDKVRKLTWGDKSADFAEKLDQIEDSSPKETPQSDHSIVLPDPDMQKLLAISPASAIVEMWKRIENQVTEITWGAVTDNKIPIEMTKNIKDRKYKLTTLPIFRSIDMMVDAGIMSNALARTIIDLRRLRNDAAHGDVTMTDALRFLTIAGTVLDDLRALPRQA